MVKRRRRIRRSKPEEEEMELEDEELDEEEQPVTKSTRRARKVEDVEEDDFEEDDDEDLEEDDEDEDFEDEEDEEEEAPPPKAKSRRVTRKVVPPPAKKAEAPAEEEEAEEETTVAVKRVDTVVAENVLTGLLDALDEGQAVVITRTGANTWQLSSGDGVAPTKKLRGQEFWNEVLTPEYQEMEEWWGDLDYDGKKKLLKKEKIKWEAHENESVDLIRIRQAYMEAKGIEKYKPEYQKRAAREAIKG